ncbi:MAG: hypothetical protein CMG66_01590 [Candidatus Marinimicrobia bacterium]|nr:hypothetical protein [Candidatus Neomarinimicrobiota bacterium]|tara:strand:+ start:37883 stop:39124 length:1242 start_codon:yes stop_codon:yes gene_type:complete
MISYIIYVLLSPIFWLLILLATCFSVKIKTNYFSFYKYLKTAKRYISINKNNKEVLLFHAASVGEYEQLQPILRLIDRKKYFIIQSFTSPSIFNKEKDNSLYDVICYHPFDLPWLSITFFLTLKPSKYIITRHDIWPGHIVIAKSFKISIYYINGNIHKNSIWLKWYMQSIARYIFNKCNKIIVPSNYIAQNLYQLNILKNKVVICRDSRFDQIIYRKETSQNLYHISDILSNDEVILFGSIDINDENIIFDSLKNIFPKGTKDLIKQKKKIIFVPHETDHKTISRLEYKLNQLTFKYSIYSEAVFNNNSVIIVDTVGILADLYKYTCIAYIGGGFSRGVHSVLEPAIYNCYIGHGPNIEMLDEAKLLINQGFSKIIYDIQDMNSFLLSSSNQKSNNLFDLESSNMILKEIVC